MCATGLLGRALENEHVRETDCNRIQRTKTLKKTQLQQRPRLTQSKVWKLDESGEGSCSFIFRQGAVTGFRLEREPNLGETAPLGKGIHLEADHQSLLQAAGGGGSTDWSHSWRSGLGTGSHVCGRHVMHPYLTE